MLNLLPSPSLPDLTEGEDEEGEQAILELPRTEVKLKKLRQKHKEVISLMAQGLDRVTVGQVTGFTPEYVTWLMKQEVCQEYLQSIVAVAEGQLQAQFCKAVDVIGDTLANGTEDGKLKAAKLQLEATGRVGKLQQPNTPPAEHDRLGVLAERLVKLLHSERERVVVNAEDAEIISSEVRGTRSSSTTEVGRTQSGAGQSEHRTVRAHGG